jgi:hypothetical protein
VSDEDDAGEMPANIPRSAYARPGDPPFQYIPPTQFVKPTQEAGNWFLNRSPDRSTKALSAFFGIHFLDPGDTRTNALKRVRNIIARWKNQYYISGLPKKPPRKQKKSKSDPKKAPAKPTQNVPTAPVSDGNNIDVLENPPKPTGYTWKGERWLVRDANDDDVYDLSRISSLEFHKCWESRRGYWWNQEEKKWRRGKVPPAYYYYYWYLTMYDNPAKYDNPHPLDPLHKRISTTYKGGKRHLTLLGRGSHKTTIFVEGRATYLICEKQDKAKAGIFISCLDDTLSKTTYNAITENLSQNPRLLSFYGYLIDTQKKSKLGRKRKFTDTTAFFTFQTTGMRPGLKCMPFGEIKITGWHPYAVFLDDIQEKALTKTYRDRYKDIFGQRIIGAVGRKGNLYITGTIKGYDGDEETFNDIYLWLEDTPGYITHKFPSVVDFEGNPIFPTIGRRGEDSEDSADIILEKQLLPVLDEDGNEIKLPSGLIYEELQDVIVEVRNREKYIINFPSVYTLEDLVYIRMEMKNDDKFFSEYQLQASNPSGKYFNKKRMRPMKADELSEFEQFQDVATFRTYVKKFNKKVCLWVDPGGESGHGMSLVVMCKDMGCWFLLDCTVIRKGVPKTAEAIAKLLEKWNIRYWGVEGNFSQKEFVGKQLKFFLRKYLKENNKMSLYKPPVLKPNTGNKIQRIKEGFSTMLGLDGMSFTFYYNPAMIAKEQFMREVREFSLEVTGRKAHEFDLLDAIVSSDTHILKDRHKKSGGGPVCSGGQFKRASITF